MRRVYIAGPYTKGDPVLNVRAAVHAADAVLRLGCFPFLPHLTMLWHLASPKDYESWLEMDLVWLECCDALVRLPGESRGADLEVAFAERRGIPVFRGLDALAAALRPIDPGAHDRED